GETLLHPVVPKARGGRRAKLPDVALEVGTREAPNILGEQTEPGCLGAAANRAVAGKYLLDQRGAGPRQTHHENRLRGPLGLLTGDAGYPIGIVALNGVSSDNAIALPVVDRLVPGFGGAARVGRERAFMLTTVVPHLAERVEVAGALASCRVLQRAFCRDEAVGQRWF